MSTAEWRRLFGFFVKNLKPGLACRLRSDDCEESDERLERMVLGEGGEFLALTDPQRLIDNGTLDLVWITPEPNWFSATNYLGWMTERANLHPEWDPPVVMMDHVGWPYGRRDHYRDLSSIPGEFLRPHRQGGLSPHQPEPVTGSGDDPEAVHAIREHPFQNGCLTAVEDFLRHSPIDLRFQVLPGYCGVAVLASTAVIDRSSHLATVFDRPGQVLLEIGMIESVEKARIEAFAGGLRKADSGAQGPVEKEEGEDSGQPIRRRAAPGGENVTILRQRLEASETEVRRLASALLQIRGLTLDLLESNRWRLGNLLGDAYLRLRRKTKTESAADTLRRLLREMSGWGLTEKVIGRPISEREGGPDDLRQALTVEDDAGATTTLYHRLVSRIEPSEEQPNLRQEIVRNEEVISTAAAGAKENQLVSVILPTHDRAQVVEQAVTSVLDQTYAKWELIICDDGSTDTTLEVLRSFTDRRITVMSIDHSGAAAARNRALEKSQGDLIAYLDSDNLWHPRYLETMVAALSQNTSYFCAFANQIDVEVEEDRSVLRELSPQRFDYESLIQRNVIDLNTLVHRRALYTVLGGFDESLVRHQDWDLVLRYGRAVEFLEVGVFLVLYRRNRRWNQISSTTDGGETWKTVRERWGGEVTELATTIDHSCLVVCDGEDPEAVKRAHIVSNSLADSSSGATVIVGGSTDSVAPPENRRRHIAVEDAGFTAEMLDENKAVGFDVVYVVPGSTNRMERLLSDAGLSGPFLVDQSSNTLQHDFGANRPGWTRVVERLTPDGSARGQLFLPPLVDRPDGEVSVPTTPMIEEPTSRLTRVLLMSPEGPSLGAPADPLDLASSVEEIHEVVEDESFFDESWFDLLRRRKVDAVVVDGGRDNLGPCARRAVALAFEKRIPVIATPTRELGRLVEGGCVAGSLRDSRAVIEAIEKLRSDPRRVDRLVEAARRHSMRRYSPEAFSTCLRLAIAYAARTT